MALSLITAPTFPELEARLLADISEDQHNDPLSPRWIVVPSATLSNHLRVRLADHAKASVLAGVRVISLPQLADRLALQLTGAATLSWHPLLELALFELVAQLPDRSPLANLKTISGGATLLRRVFTDLAEGGFGLADLPKVRAFAAEPDLAPRERAVLELFADWVTQLDKRGVCWAPLTLQGLPDAIERADDATIHSVLAAEQGQIPRLFVHGFYEWLDVHLQWLLALAERIPTVILYPWSGSGNVTHPAFSFTESVLEDLRARTSGHKPTTTDEPATTSCRPPKRPPQRSSPTSAKFFLESFPEGAVPDQPPPFLTFQRASGTRAEAISAAVRIRRWLDEDRFAPEDILVVAPQASDYVEAVQQVFHTFGIPLRVTDVAAGPTPEDEPFRMLGKIWEDQAPAEWILALLRAQPDLPIMRGIALERFERVVRERGIWGGAAWRTALNHGCFEPHEHALVESISAFVPADTNRQSQWLAVEDALPVLERLAADWLTVATPLQPLIESVRAVKRYSPKLGIELRQWTRLLAECGGAKTQRDPLHRAVLFTPLMRARGLTARAVVLLGLAAGQFPQRIDDDPILSENTARRIARIAAEIGHRLPVNARLTEEMVLLFQLINTAAEKIHWVIPEADATGKAVAPTPWVQRYLQRWPDHQEARIGRSPAMQARHLLALDRQTGRFLPPSFTLLVDPELAQQILPAAAAVPAGEEIAWSGGIGRAPDFRNHSVAVNKLEALARCPFRFYVDTIARWESLEALSLSHSLDALTRGTLLHRLLEQLVKPHLNKQSLGTIAAAALAGNGAALWNLAKQLTRTDRDLAFALALLPPVFQRAAWREIIRMATAYLVWAEEHDRDAVPHATETEFRRGFPGVEGLEIVGKIDRIDHRDGTVDLIDFKTGRYPRAPYRRSVKLGWQIQATLYPWLCRQDNATFQYAFLGSETLEIGDTKGAPGAEAFLLELAPIIEQGAFLPTSNQVMEELGVENCHTCRYCRAASACRRFERDAAQRQARLYETLMPKRLASIIAVFNK